MKKPTIKTYRRILQVLVVLAFIIIPILNRSRYSLFYGNFLSFHFWIIPLSDPLAVLQLSIKNLYITFENVIGVLIPLIAAATMGTVFCSWVCPFGFLSEIANSISKKLMHKNYSGLNVKWNSFLVKMIIFIIGFVGFFAFSTTPVLNQLSMPAWYSRFFQYLFGQGYISWSIFFIFGLLLVEIIAKQRFWCRYICPQSVIIVLAKRLSLKRLKVVFDKEKCICREGYESCNKACSLSLQPKNAGDSSDLDCTNCGDCIVACIKKGKALDYNLIRTIGVDKFRKIVLQATGGVLLIVLGIVFYQTSSYVKDVEIDQEIKRAEALTASLLVDNDKLDLDNPLLKNKRISWHGAKADYYEFLADGTCVAYGGEYPLEGYRGMAWESVDKNGSFKIINNISDSSKYFIARFNKNAVNRGVMFELVETFEDTSNEKKLLYKITKLENIDEKSSIDASTKMDARVYVTRYAEGIYVLELSVADAKTKIKKISTSGTSIGNEVMVTNASRWNLDPPVELSSGTPPQWPIKTRMKILFHSGEVKVINFITNRATVDKSDEVFDDIWF